MNRTRLRIESAAAPPMSALFAGDGEPGPLIVCLHGGGYNASYFDVEGASMLATAAAAGHPVVAIDRPGHGDTAPARDGESGYASQAEALGAAIGEVWDSHGQSAPGVLLVGHSIGAAIAVHIAAAPQTWPLLGISLAGLGDSAPPDGDAPGRDLPPGEPVETPEAALLALFFGPDWTVDPEVAAASIRAAEPAPRSEVEEIYNGWPRDFPLLGPRIRVPVQYALAEFEALWESSPAALDRFVAGLPAAPFVDARIAPGVGHNIDHHRLGEAWRRRQLAFAQECALWHGGAPA